MIALQGERYRRLHELMDGNGLDALVVLATAAVGRKGALRYVTNYSLVSRYGGVVFPRSGDPVLFVPYAVHIAWAESISWVEDVRLSGNFTHDIAARLHDLGAARRIGLVGQDTLPDFARTLAERLPGRELVPADAAFARLRMIKSPLEIGLARQAARMAGQVFAETATRIAAGATEVEVFATTEATLRRLHAEESLLLIDSVGHQVMPIPSERAVAAGDLVQYSVEPVSPGGHWIQSIRMFSRGEPDRRARAVIDTFEAALATAEAALRPGVPLRDVAAQIAAVLEPVAPQGRIPYGHGIGMDNFEAPVLSVDSEVVADPNLVIVVHPALEVAGRHYFLGDTFLVTETGAERLANDPLTLTVV